MIPLVCGDRCRAVYRDAEAVTLAHHRACPVLVGLLHGDGTGTPTGLLGHRAALIIIDDPGPVSLGCNVGPVAGAEFVTLGDWRQHGHAT